MKYINACIIAFSMYSKIPVPTVEWEKENMKYVMCFFPLIGAVIGLCFYLWGIYAENIPIGKNLYAVILTVIPVAITGGIHVDGLLDTADALSSWQTKERRLEILKDSHAGAFAVIVGCLYFLSWFGFACELNQTEVPVISLGFFLSRCLSGFAVTSFPCAKNSGLAVIFAEGAEKKKARFILIIETIVGMSIILWTDIFLGTAAVVASIVSFFWYYKMSIKKFGGITGDLAGCFLQICELMIMIFVIVAQKISLIDV